MAQQHVDFTKEGELMARLYECGCRELVEAPFAYVVPTFSANLASLVANYHGSDAQISSPHTIQDCPFRSRKPGCPHEGGSWQ